MLNRRFILAVLFAAPFMIGAEGNCSRVSGPDDEEIPDPNSPEQPFLDQFNGGLVNWRLTVPIPNHQLGSGNPLPSLEVGSVSTLVTGGVTVRKFDISNGLVIEADVYWEAATGQTTAVPQVWFGLSEDDDPTGNPGIAAGMWVDDSGTIHFQVNGSDIGEETAPSTGAWHRFLVTIRADRVVEFRIDGVLRLTGGSVDSWYLVRPVEACGIGYPQRPRIDNVNVRLP